MARILSTTIQDEIRVAFLESGSIKQAAKEARVSRNAARDYLRSEGLSASPPTGHKLIEAPLMKSDAPKLKLWALDFSLLEQLFELGKNNLENLSPSSPPHRRSDHPMSLISRSYCVPKI